MTESRRKRGNFETNGKKGMTLPFQPLNLAFHHMYYSVDMPSVSPLISCSFYFCVCSCLLQGSI